ncbi:MAG: hypothetical protein ABIG89_03865 [Candidatus Woesearchaeota archaeon]
MTQDDIPTQVMKTTSQSQQIEDLHLEDITKQSIRDHMHKYIIDNGIQRLDSHMLLIICLILKKKEKERILNTSENIDQFNQYASVVLNFVETFNMTIDVSGDYLS